MRAVCRVSQDKSRAQSRQGHIRPLGSKERGLEIALALVPPMSEPARPRRGASAGLPNRSHRSRRNLSKSFHQADLAQSGGRSKRPRHPRVSLSLMRAARHESENAHGEKPKSEESKTEHTRLWR